MNEDMVHNPPKPEPTSISTLAKLMNAVSYMSQALIREKANKVTRAGITTNKSQGQSKSRKRMAKMSRRRNRK